MNHSSLQRLNVWVNSSQRNLQWTFCKADLTDQNISDCGELGMLQGQRQKILGHVIPLNNHFLPSSVPYLTAL